MRRKQSLITAVLMLMLVLTACTGAPVGDDSISQPVPAAPAGDDSVSQPAPAAPDPLPLQTPADPAEPDRELTEEDVRALYSDDLIVRSVEPQEGGWLVCYSEGDVELYTFDWVFPSGSQCVLGYFFLPGDRLSVTGPGEVTAYRTAGDSFNLWRHEMPEVVRMEAVEGQPYAFCQSQEIYLPLEAPWSFGAAWSDRYEQLYQVRLGVTGLECAFLPDSSSQERFQSFFPMGTSIPYTQVTFDPETRTLTLRLCRTTLSSGALTREHVGEYVGVYAGEMGLFERYSPYYPCSIPEGSLGENGPWITNAQVRQEGEDVLITMDLADEVTGYRLEDLGIVGGGYRILIDGGGLVPCFRLEFTSWESELFPIDRLPE